MECSLGERGSEPQAWLVQACSLCLSFVPGSSTPKELLRLGRRRRSRWREEAALAVGAVVATE